MAKPDSAHTRSNCLLGAFYLMVYLRSFQLRVLWLRNQRYIPHFYVIDSKGNAWHFQLVRDVLPGPLGWAWFWGRYQPLEKERITR